MVGYASCALDVRLSAGSLGWKGCRCLARAGSTPPLWLHRHTHAWLPHTRPLHAPHIPRRLLGPLTRPRCPSAARWGPSPPRSPLHPTSHPWNALAAALAALSVVVYYSLPVVAGVVHAHASPAREPRRQPPYGSPHTGRSRSRGCRPSGSSARCGAGSTRPRARRYSGHTFRSARGRRAPSACATRDGFPIAGPSSHPRRASRGCARVHVPRSGSYPATRRNCGSRAPGTGVSPAFPVEATRARRSTR